MVKQIKTVYDLKNMVDHFVNSGLGESSIGIVVKESGIVLGPTPTVGIQWVTNGFDWDSGRILIQPETPLKKADAISQLDEIKAYYERLIYEYEAGISSIEDEEKDFKSYQDRKQCVQTLEAVELNYKLAHCDTLQLSKHKARELRLLNQIKCQTIQDWILIEELTDYFKIERAR